VTAPADILLAPLKAVQGRLLGETIDHCYRGHQFYRELMRSERLMPDDINDPEDNDQPVHLNDRRPALA
jgi:hypothetical protein